MESGFVFIIVLIVILVIYIMICVCENTAHSTKDLTKHKHQDDQADILPKSHTRLVFLCAARNAMDGLPTTLRNFERVHKVFPQTSCVFVENDSQDETREFLENKFGPILPTTIIDGILPEHANQNTYGKSAGRITRMCAVRNQLLHAIDSKDMYFIMYDADWDTVLDIDQFSRAIKYLDDNPEVQAVVPMLFKRTPLCPFVAMYHDTFAYVDEHTKNMSHRQKAFYLRTKKWDYSLDFIPVQSAYGCMAIYRNRMDLPQYTAEPFDTKTYFCEHVPFNSKMGPVHLLPWFQLVV